MSPPDYCQRSDDPNRNFCRCEQRTCQGIGDDQIHSSNATPMRARAAQ